MLYRHRIFITAVVLLMPICAFSAHGQGVGRRSESNRQVSQKQPPAKYKQQRESDRFWAAQRSIEAAIQQLEEYLKDYPDGERAATARRQVEALRGLSVTAATPEWVRMGPSYLREMPEWRVSSVDSQQNKVRVTVEVACRRSDGGDCYFDAFDRAPLVLVDNAGQYYPMLEAARLPADVKVKNGGQVVLSSGRAIVVMAEFAPLSVSAVSGQIYYRDNNRAQPARFSLTR